jgi:hypothetical protein
MAVQRIYCQGTGLQTYLILRFLTYDTSFSKLNVACLFWANLATGNILC